MCERESARGSEARLAVSPRRLAGRFHVGRRIRLVEYAELPTGDACPPVGTVFWRSIEFAPFFILVIRRMIP